MIHFTLPLTIYSLLQSLSTAYDDTSCAFYSTHVLAVPLETCAVYSYDDSKWSWDFFCLNDEVKCRYFDGDTTCNVTDETPMTSVDEAGSTVQCIGAGANCHTVDVKVNGFTDADTDACEDADDYFQFSFVVDECIPSVLENSNYSAVLSCDSEKIYFEYYTGCLDCNCEMEEYTYEYYSDFDGCWEVVCGIHTQTGVGHKPTTTEEETRDRCENVDSKHHANKLKAMLSKRMDFTKARYQTSKKKAFMTNVINENDIKQSTGSLYNKIEMNSISIVAVLCIIIVLGGAWNFIKEKQYSMI